MTSLSGPVGVTTAERTGAPSSVWSAAAGANVHDATPGSVPAVVLRHPWLAMGSVCTDSGPAAALVVTPGVVEVSVTVLVERPANVGAVTVRAESDGARHRVRLASTSKAGAVPERSSSKSKKALARALKWL